NGCACAAGAARVARTTPSSRTPRKRPDARAPWTALMSLLLGMRTEVVLLISDITPGEARCPHRAPSSRFGVGGGRNVTGGLTAPASDPEERARALRAIDPRERTPHVCRGDRNRWSSGRDRTRGSRRDRAPRGSSPQG